MAVETRARRGWEPRLLGWANIALEASVFYLLLAAWARPRAGPAALLPLLSCLALFAASALRAALQAETTPQPSRQLALWLAGLAWALVVARLCAPPEYWASQGSRSFLLLGVIFGGRDGAGLQPLAFWSSLLLWWRGQALLSWEPGIEDALSRLRLGCLAAGAAVAFAVPADSPETALAVQFEQTLGLAAFLVAALATTGLSRRQEMAGGTVSGPTLSGSRAAARPRAALVPMTVVACALLALLLAVGGAQSLSPEALSPVVAVGGQILSAIGAGLAWLLAWLSGLLPSFQPLPQPTPFPRPPAGPPDRLPELPGEAPAWLGPLLLLLTLAGLLAVLLLLSMAFRRASAPSGRDEPAGTDEDEQPLPIAPRGPASILWLVVRLFRALFTRRPSSVGPGGSAGAEYPAADAGFLPIRAAYRAFLAWASDLGYPRQSAETPDELQQRLAECLPAAEPEVALLTRLYVAARYGGEHCPPADLRRAQSALSRLQSWSATQATPDHPPPEPSPELT